MRVSVVAADIENEAAFLYADVKMIWSGIAIAHVAQRFEEIFLDQIENRHTTLLFDVSIASEYRGFVEFDFDDARVAHVAVLAGQNFWATLGQIFVHSPVPDSIFAKACAGVRATG